MASLSSETTTTVLATRDDRRHLITCGAELVELSERFYRGLFVGGVVFVGMAALASLAMLPWRESVDTAGPPITVIVTALIAALTPLAVWRAAALYRILRRTQELELLIVVVSAVLAAYPLRSELWWPSCALIILLAILAPLRRALAYCLVVLLTNLAAHTIAGDLAETPAVAILGLWIGYPFWAATFSIISERFAAHVLQLATSSSPAATEPVRVTAWVPSDPGASETNTQNEDTMAAPAAASGDVMSRLTARQLQVTALLVDGLRYREVAACLSITEHQIQRHVANAIARAGVRNANELIAIAVSEGLAPPRQHRHASAQHG